MTEIDDLTAILTEERALLKAGRIATLAEAGARKTELLDRLLAHPPAGGAARAALARLAAEARVNERLIGAALRGVQAAVGRLKAVRDAVEGLTAYTADGKSVRHTTRPGTVEKRA
ncbi:hypothetical protein [Frigidibacter sp. SD6-1]|uniref:hypothetical protein n=1 Tax=Frigidibacter sp. SD6-1 TaxID=3032581 RepID=UPI0024DF42DC|nr:hypothetical protein [Frigidibacter sp. SD6-1]